MFKKNKKELKNIQELSTQNEIKEFLTNISEYLTRYGKMLEKNEKETKACLERYYVLTFNYQKKGIILLKSLLNLAFTDLKKFEELYNRSKPQIDKLNSYLVDESFIEKQELLLAVSNSFKELVSINQWKERDYRKIFNSSVSFVMDFDSVSYAKLNFNSELKQATLTDLVLILKNYNLPNVDFEQLSVSELHKKLVKDSREVSDFQKRLFKITKGYLTSEDLEKLNAVDSYKNEVAL